MWSITLAIWSWGWVMCTWVRLWQRHLIRASVWSPPNITLHGHGHLKMLWVLAVRICVSTVWKVRVAISLSVVLRKCGHATVKP